MRYSRSAITQLTKWYKSVLIKCALLNAAFFVSMGAVNANAAAPTITNGDDAAYTWKESGANTGIKVNVDETDYYVDIKKTTYNTDKTLTYTWDEEEHELTVTASDLTTSKPTADTAGNYIGNFINNSVGSTNGGALNNSGTIGTLQGDFIANRTIAGYHKSYTGYGGAIYNTGTINNITGDFISNGASGDTSAAYYSNMGGAIYNAAAAVIGNISGNFIANYARLSYGGGIYNKGSITKITADFIGNWASGGSAIYNAVGGSISDISGDYIGNFSTALHNQGTIGKIKGNFLKNRGVAIYNESGDIDEISGYFTDISGQYGAIHSEIDSNNLKNATIGSITGEFIGNTAEDYSGGAIFVESYSGDYEANIGKITGTFKNNTAGINGYGDGNGGAIYIRNYSNAETIEKISGTFENNSAKYRGGAIYFAGKTDLISGTFKNNSVIFTANIDNARGGALYTEGTITSLTGAFENNTSSGFGGALYATGSSNIVNSTADFSGNGAVYGGAISNFGQITLSGNLFENNSASRYGGAIYTGGNATITNATFTGNSATYKGGAILSYNQTTEILDSSFTNNKSPEGAAIFVNGGTVNITAKNKDVEFTNNNTTGLADGTGTGIKTVAGSTLSLSAQNGNKITINDSVDLKGTTNINGGEIVLGKKAANSITDAANLRISGGTLNIANNNIDTLSFANTINNLNDFNLIIDVNADGETVTADKITAGLNYANYVYLSALNFMNDSSQSGEVQIADGYLKGLVKLANNFDSGIYTTVGYNKTTGILSFADPVNWTKRTNGVNSIYKWTKTNTGLMPVSYNDQTFYVDILKKSYTDDSHYDHEFKYTWDNENHILTVTNSDDSALVIKTGTRTGTGTKEDPYNFAGDYIGGNRLNPYSYVNNISGNYIGHAEYGGAGAFYISYDADLITTINANFIGNKTADNGNGGAIENRGTISDLTGDFIGNKAHWSGGAIYNRGQIQTIKGDYIGNTAQRGGAIYNYSGGTINSITGNFINNHSTHSGGAIYNGVSESSSAATIDSISGNFVNNQSTYGGGAIYSINSNISSIAGDFIGNRASNGGAIYLGADEDSSINPVIDSITGRFENNTAKTSGGGAIDTYVYDEAGKKMTINTIAADFIGNKAEKYSGGAVYNYYNITIGTLTGKFENNSSDDSSGGGIYNSGTINMLTADFENNSAAYYGGAIYNQGILNIVDSSFTGNKATQHGGAIYNYWGTTNIIAKDKNVAFTNNNTTGTPEGTDYGIYVTSGTLGLNTNTDKAITINDDIYLSSESYTSVNLNINTDENYHNGTVEFNGALIVDTSKLNTTLGGGTVKLGTDAATVNLRNMTVSGNTTLDLQNNSAGDVLSVSNYTGTANLSLNLDYDGEGTIDRMYIGNSSASGNIVLNSIKVLADGNATYTQFLSSPSDDIIVTTSNPEDNTKLIVANDNYKYTFTLSDDFGYLEVSRTALGSNLATAIADATIGSYTMDSDFTFDENGQGTLAGDGRNFTIFGQDHVIDGGGTYSYIKTSAGQTLNIENATFQNMSPAISNQGNLNLKNVTFAAQDYTDVINNGTLNLDGTNTVNYIAWDKDNPNKIVNVNGGTTTVRQAIYYQSELNVAEGATLILGNEYSSILSAFDNKGTLQINGQLNVYNGNLTNSGTISGDGFIVIGAGDSEAYLENTGTIHNLLATDKGTVKTAVENVTGTINNRGTLLLSGTLNKNIYKGNTSALKQGVIKIDGTLKIDASGAGDKTIYTSSIIDPNGGTIDMKNNQIDTLWVSSNKTTGTGNLTLDVDLSGETVKSDVFYATGSGSGSTNNDVLTVTDLGIIGELKPFEAQILQGDVYHRSLLLSDAVAAKYNKTVTSDRYESDDLTATASWDDTFNSKKYETETIKKLETYAADSYTPYHQGLRYTETTGEETLVEETPLGDTLVLLNQASQFGDTERKFITSDAGAVHNVTADLGTTAAGKFTVKGATDGSNTSTIDLKGKDGFKVGSGATLVLDTVNIKGAKAKDGALVDNKSGTVELNNVEIAESSKATIANNATLNIKGNNNIKSGIKGTGTTNIKSGKTTLAAIEQNKINIASGAVLNADADKVKATIANSGTYTITGGTISKNVTGSGSTIIAGNVKNNANIANDITINSGKVLTTAADTVNDVTNNGVLKLSGSLNKAISGNGTTKVDKTLILAEGATVAGILDANGGTLDMSDGAINDYAIGTLKGTGNIKLDVDLAQGKADTLTAAAGESGALTVTDLNIGGTMSDFTVDVLKGSTDNITLALSDDVQNKYNTASAWQDKSISDELTQNAAWTDTFSTTTWQERNKSTLSVVDNAKLQYATTLEKQNEKNTIGDTLSLLNQATQFGAKERQFVTDDANAVHNVTADLGATADGKLTVQGATDGSNTSTIDLKGKDGFKVSDGAEVVLDTVKLVGAKAEDGALIDNESGTVTLKDVEVAENSKPAINNDSTMKLSGTNNIESGIGGNGTTDITDGKTALGAKLTQKKVNVKSGAALKANADNIDAPVANNGTYDVTGGTIGKDVTGNGATVIKGNVQNKAKVANDITVNAGKSLTSNADNIGGNVTSDGTYNATGGTIGKNVTGGKLNIKGDVSVGDNADVSTKSANVAKGASLDVGTNSVDLGDTTIDGTIKLEITDIEASSNKYTGGQINAKSLNLGKDSKLSLTIAPNLIAKKTSTGALDIINVSGATTGQFAEMLSNNRYKLASTSDGKFVITNYASVADIINEAGGTGNDIATGETWDETRFATGSKASEVQNVLNELSQHDEHGYVKALTDLAPTDSMAHVGITQDFNNLIGEQIAARLNREGLNSGDVFEKRGAWIQTLYNHSKQDENSKNQGFTGKTAGVALGLDGEIKDNLTVGLGYAYGKSDVDSAGRDIDIDGHTLYIYGKYQPSAWYVRGLAHYGFAEYEEKANIAGIANKAKYDVHNYGARAFVGYDMPNGFTPEAGLRLTRIDRKNYTDSLGQHVKSDGIDVLTASLSMNYSTNFATDSFIWSPKAHIAATYDLLSDDSSATVTVGNGLYNIEGKKLHRLGAEAGIGAEIGVGNWEFSAEYDLGARKDYLSHTGMLKAKYNF